MHEAKLVRFLQEEDLDSWPLNHLPFSSTDSMHNLRVLWPYLIRIFPRMYHHSINISYCSFISTNTSRASIFLASVEWLNWFSFRRHYYHLSDSQVACEFLRCSVPRFLFFFALDFLARFVKLAHLSSPVENWLKVFLSGKVSTKMKVEWN